MGVYMMKAGESGCLTLLLSCMGGFLFLSVQAEVVYLEPCLGWCVGGGGSDGDGNCALHGEGEGAILMLTLLLSSDVLHREDQVGSQLSLG